jgi:hypothetical protein
MSEKQTMKRTMLYVLRTHLWNTSIDHLWKELQQEFGSANVWVLFDATPCCASRSHVPQHIQQLFETTEQQCKLANPLHQSCYRTVESQLILFHRHLKEAKAGFDYLYCIEYDVRCVGSWKHCLSKVDNEYGDFMASHDCPITGKEEELNSWDGPLSDPIQTARTTDLVLWSFFPVTRFSCRFLERIEKEWFGKITAYCELLFPTLILHSKELSRNYFSHYNMIPKRLYRFQGNLTIRELIRCHRFASRQKEHSFLVHPVRNNDWETTATTVAAAQAKNAPDPSSYWMPEMDVGTLCEFLSLSDPNVLPHPPLTSTRMSKLFPLLLPIALSLLTIVWIKVSRL